MATEFAVTWDYRCPFARNAHEHVVAGLKAGADWDVRFVPFSLSQVHVEPGQADVWDDPAKASGLLAMQAGIVVRDEHPGAFLDAHEALFAARHDQGLDLRDADVLAGALSDAGLDGAAVLARAQEADIVETFRKEHEAAARDHRVWGVPTFIKGDAAVFVRLMHRPRGDGAEATRTIARVVDLLGWSELNEFKHTSIPR